MKNLNYIKIIYESENLNNTQKISLIKEITIKQVKLLTKLYKIRLYNAKVDLEKGVLKPEEYEKIVLKLKQKLRNI